MAKPSISIDDEVLDKFDDAIWEKKMSGELPRDASRSSVIQELMEEYIAQQEGNSKPRMMAQTAD